MRSILAKTSRHEMEVEKRFKLHAQIPTSPGVSIDLPQFSIRPIRMEIPAVTKGFVFLLVSLRVARFNTCFVGETSESLLKELSLHNSGGGNCLTAKKHLRPWSVAAFAFNFPSDDERIDLTRDLDSYPRLTC